MKQTFEQALKYIKELPPTPRAGDPEISNQDKLDFYALFKQATDGQNKTKAPSRLKVVERYKWDAWHKLGKMSKDQAMKNYVQKLNKLNPKWNLKPKL